MQCKFEKPMFKSWFLRLKLSTLVHGISSKVHPVPSWPAYDFPRYKKKRDRINYGTDRCSFALRGERSLKDGNRHCQHVGILNAITYSFQYGDEWRPLLWISMPAVDHNPISWTGTSGWGFQSPSARHQLHYFLIASARIRHVTQRHDLP